MTVRRVLLLAGQIILAGIFIAAGYLKLREPWLQFAVSINSLKVVPDNMLEPLARTLPWFELALGILILTGVWLRWSAAVASLMLAVFFLLPPMSAVIDLILRTQWGSLINFPHMIAIIWSHLFRISAPNRHAGGFDVVPLWAAWASVLSLCAFCFWLLHLKLRAREVERG